MAIRKKRIVIIFFVFLLGTAGIFTQAAAQECVRIASIPEHITITLKGPATLSAGSPGVFCSLEPGQEYLLSIGKTGYETRVLGATLNLDNQRIEFSSKRMGKLCRSLVLPGWGQYAGGEKLRAAETFLGSAGLGWFWYYTYRKYIDERDHYYSFAGLAADVEFESQKIKYTELAGITSRLTNANRSYMVEATALCGWMYAGNLVETFFLSAPPKVKAHDGFSATLETPRISKTRAVMKSIFFPGMGQKYLGKPFKGFFLQAVFTTAAVLTIKARREYNIANIHYELAAEAVEQAETQHRADRARRDLSIALDDRRDEEKKRNAYYIILGSLWTLNVLDAFFSTEDVSCGVLIDLETSYNSSGFQTGIRIGF